MKNSDDGFDSGFGFVDDEEGGGDAILDLLDVSAQWLVANPDPQAFMARLASEGPALFPQLVIPLSAGANAPPSATGGAGLFRCLAWGIASAMPMPNNGFKPNKLPLPGRNDACVCGSGAKFKHCCSPLFSAVPALDPEVLGAMVVKALPAGRWAALPHEHVSTAMVVTAATLLCEEDRAEDALALLRPWGQLPPPWPDKRADLLDLLGDLLLDFELQEEREQLARHMVQFGDKQVQSLGWQRLSLMATDAGDDAAAREAFEKAQRLTPNDPRVAILEVTTLLGQGEAERARERAAFHVKRLSRLPDAHTMVDAIEALEELAEENSALSQHAGAMLGGVPLPIFEELRQWLDGLPPPKLRLTLPPAPCDDLGELRPTAAAKKALRQWHDSFPLNAPHMAWESVGDEALEVFDSTEWLPVLKAQPILIDCFDVIDGLLTALNRVPFGLASGSQAMLMERALQLWQQLQERHPKALCEWGHWGNRPALRLLAQHIGIDTTPKAEAAYPWLSYLVNVLNPHDNHGLRERLAAVHLRRGETALALTLCERYPDDTVGMTLLHARALLAAGRLDEAAARLADALQRNVHIAELLVDSRAPRMPEVPSYKLGSIEEARIALSEQFDLWCDDPAVKRWLQARLQPGHGKAGTTADLF